MEQAHLILRSSGSLMVKLHQSWQGGLALPPDLSQGSPAPCPPRWLCHPEFHVFVLPHLIRVINGARSASSAATQMESAEQLV